MAPKRNNIVPNGHFKKDWQNRVRCYFNQPAKKKARRVARQTVSRPSRPLSAVLSLILGLMPAWLLCESIIWWIFIVNLAVTFALVAVLFQTGHPNPSCC